MAKGNFFDLYQTSKTRVCVTVGMMTTGYDCPDLLNVCLMRPIFRQPILFRLKDEEQGNVLANKEVLKDKSLIENIEPEKLQKSKFKLFDFFANCEFFEEKFKYDEVIKLPPKGSTGEGTGGGGYVSSDDYDSTSPDPLKSMRVNEIGAEGMKIDRMYFDKFEDKVKEDIQIQEMVLQKDFEAIEQYILQYF